MELLFKKEEMITERSANRYPYYKKYISIREKLEEKYKTSIENLKLGEAIYISKNGNLVFALRTVDYFLSKDEFQDAILCFREEMERLAPWQKKICAKNNIKFYSFRSKEEPIYSFRSKEEPKGEFQICNKKMIVTKDGRFFYLRGKRIMRLSDSVDNIKKLITILKSFIDTFGPALEKDKESFQKALSFFNSFPFFKVANDWFALSGLLEAIDSISNPKIVKEILTKNLGSYPKTITKRYHHEGVSVLVRYLSLKHIGFENPDAINSLLNSVWHPHSFTALKRYLPAVKKVYQGSNVNCDMLVAKRMEDSFAFDSLNMLNAHILRSRKYKNLEKLEPNFYKKSLKDVHNYLSALTRSDLALINRVDYEYDESYKIFEKTIKGYSFILPKNTEELTRLAKVMNNCVAGYSRAIKQKASIIVYATNNKNIIDYVRENIGSYNELIDAYKKNKIDAPLCIELSPNVKASGEVNQEDFRMYGYVGCATRVVRQCFEPYNNVPSEVSYSIAKKYFDTIGYRYKEERINKTINEIVVEGLEDIPF